MYSKHKKITCLLIDFFSFMVVLAEDEQVSAVWGAGFSDS